MKDGLLEGFKICGLGGLERGEGANFFGQRVEFLDDFSLLRKRREGDFYFLDHS